jgi:hypothetical protein
MSRCFPARTSETHCQRNIKEEEVEGTKEDTRRTRKDRKLQCGGCLIIDIRNGTF